MVPWVTANWPIHILNKMFTQQSSQHCQSRFYKDWHPDYISSYNSLNDKHLRQYFNHPARKNHLGRNNYVRGGYITALPFHWPLYYVYTSGITNFRSRLPAPL